MRARLLVLAVLLAAVAAVLRATSWQAGNAWLAPPPAPGRLEVHLVLAQDGRAEPLSFHYLEHLTWLNTLAPGQRTAGRHSNAWTSDLAVGYWLSGRPQDLAEMLRLLSGVFKPLALPGDFAAQERTLLQREYDLRMGENISAQVKTALDAFLYQGNRDAATPLGTPEQIAALEYDRARALHEKSHLPEQARLVVLGDVTPGQLRRALAAAGLGGGPDLPAPTAPPPFLLAAPETRVFTFDRAEAAPRLVWRRVVRLEAPVGYDLLETQAALLSDILDSNLPGGLAGPLRFDAFVTRSFSVAVTALDERHVELRFDAAPDTGVPLARVQSAFEAALAEAARGIPQATWARIRARFAAYWPDWDDPRARDAWMAEYVLDRVQNLRSPLGEREIRALDEQLARQDLGHLLAALAGPGRTAIALIGKEPQ